MRDGIFPGWILAQLALEEELVALGPMHTAIERRAVIRGWFKKYVLQLSCRHGISKLILEDERYAVGAKEQMTAQAVEKLTVGIFEKNLFNSEIVHNDPYNEVTELTIFVINTKGNR